MTTRRLFLAAALGGLAALPARASGLVDDIGLRGGLDDVLPVSGGTSSGGGGSQRFRKVLAEAAAKGKPVFLPPGTYRVSDLDLPDNTEINGVPGRTRIEYTGDGQLFTATNARRIRLYGLEIDGANRWLADPQGGLVAFSAVAEVEIENCTILGSSGNGIRLEGRGGSIRDCRITGAALAGIHAAESRALSIRDNHVEACANGGILVHRYTAAEDGTMISGNRVRRIGARAGGTGQNGNGINIFRAGNVIVSANHVEDCAFSAIRANSASGISITGNQCLRSGETALYAEFSFEGTVISANTIDGAANGIAVVNFNEGGRLSSITGNIVRNIAGPGPYPASDAGFGIGISAEADSVISGNAIDTVEKWGMLVGWGPYLRNVSVSGNMVRAVPVGCAVSVAEGVGSALISGNVFSATPAAAIAGFRWNEQASGELIGSGESYPGLILERNILS